MESNSSMAEVGPSGMNWLWFWLHLASWGMQRSWATGLLVSGALFHTHTGDAHGWPVVDCSEYSLNFLMRSQCLVSHGYDRLPGRNTARREGLFSLAISEGRVHSGRKACPSMGWGYGYCFSNDSHTRKQRTWQGRVKDTISPRTHLQWLTLARKPYLLKVLQSLKSISLDGDQVSNHRSLWGTLHFTLTIHRYYHSPGIGKTIYYLEFRISPKVSGVEGLISSW